MRWQRLFAELEYELARGDVDPELSEQERRLAASRLTLILRLEALAKEERPLAFWADRGKQTLTLDSVGADWFAGPGRAGEYRIVHLDAVESFDGALVPPAPTAARVAPSPVTFGMLLRDLTRRRVPVSVVTQLGEWHGTLTGAWADHCELAVHPFGAPCRRSGVREDRIFPYRKLSWITLVGPA